MKKFIVIFILATAFIHGNDHCYSCNRWEVGPHFSYADVKFKNAPSRNGFASGVSALYMHYRQSGLYVDTYFKGSWSNKLDDCNDNKSRLADYLAEARAGYTYDWCESSFIVFFAGLGYNRLNLRQDNTDNTQTRFKYSKVYIPIGIFGLWQINDCFSLGMRVKVKPDVHPILTIESPNIAQTDVFFKLAYRYGIDVQIPFTYYFTCNCVSGLISLIPYLDYNKYGRELLTNTTCSLRRILTGGILAIGIEY